MTKHNVLKGFIELVEKRYGLKVVDSHYIQVDKKYDLYNFMLEVRLKPDMATRFREQYPGTSAMHVAWSFFQDRVRFHAEKGNNILLLLDSVKM